MSEYFLEQLKTKKILCVEDENAIRELIVNTLKFYFMEVFEAQSGKEAYEIYEENKIDILLTDIQMSNINGIELIKNIRKKDKNIAIVVLTAYSNEEYLMDLINLNILHYILKPLNHKKLNIALIKYVDEFCSKNINLTDDIILDLVRRELVYYKKHIVLTKKEKDFLMILYQNKNKIISYEKIEYELWFEKDMTQNALKSFIKKLRAKLPYNIIKNIPQEGYVFENNKE